MIKKQLLVLSLAGILPMSSIAAGTSSVESIPEFVNSVANAVEIQSQKLDSKQNLAAAARTQAGTRFESTGKRKPLSKHKPAAPAQSHQMQ